MNGFELVDFSVHAEDLGRLEVPLQGATDRVTLVLPEGAVVNLGLTFRLGQDIDGLTFEETRVREGAEVSSTRTALGGYRTGGPYEVRLPAERLPVGHAHRGVYAVTSRFTDGDGHELATVHHRMRLVHPTPPAAAPQAAATARAADPAGPDG